LSFRAVLVPSWADAKVLANIATKGIQTLFSIKSNVTQTQWIMDRTRICANSAPLPAQYPCYSFNSSEDELAAGLHLGIVSSCRNNPGKTHHSKKGVGIRNPMSGP
jgi:hypothetical protein